MKELPRHKVRRNFFLKPGVVPERKPSPFLFPMRLAAGLASAALVILLALDATVFFRGRDADSSCASRRPPGSQRSYERGKSRLRSDE